MRRVRARSASASSLRASQPPIIGEGVLLRAHRHAVGVSEHVAHDVDQRAPALSRLALPDEPGVLGEAASIDDERLAEAMRQRGRGADILEALGWPPPALLVTVIITQGTASPCSFRNVSRRLRSMLRLDAVMLVVTLHRQADSTVFCIAADL
jgi:hypothetical protein